MKEKLDGFIDQGGWHLESLVAYLDSAVLFNPAILTAPEVVEKTLR